MYQHIVWVPVKVDVLTQSWNGRKIIMHAKMVAFMLCSESPKIGVSITEDNSRQLSSKEIGGLEDIPWY